ncbi:MAG: hypothetical protein IH968_14260 [Gemmatimonadetes bacterium]|nr:hypothetical protein [Gemmatimonadota bacterium]
MSLFAELKRRNVFRVAAAAAVVAWLVTEVASVVLPTFGAPDWVLKALITLLMIGFPIALIFAWVYEITPEGVKLERDVDRSRSITSHTGTGRRLDVITIALVVLGVGFVMLERFVWTGDPQLAVESALESEAVSDRSIAVLAFVNMSDDPGNEYFSDGVSEEILNALAKIPELKVAARTSTFQFKGQNQDIAEIGKLLKVSNVLEGSVRKVGNRVRVTAQLIKVEDGFHLWSATFDRELTDIWAIQDEIAAAIAAAMRTTLNLGNASVGNLTGTTSLEAYELYLKGIQQWHLREAASLRESERLFLASVQIDPEFAKAHAGLAMTYAVMPSYLFEAEGPYLLKTRRAAERALEIDPESVEAMAALMWLSGTNDLEESTRLFERAIAINPSFATVYQWFASIVMSSNDLDEGLRLYRRAFELDPRSRIIGNNLAGGLLSAGMFDEALIILADMESFAPDYNENLEIEFMIRLIREEFDQARAVGERLARVLNKRASRLDVYIALFGPEAGRAAAADVLLSWQRDSRPDPDSPVLIYDFDLVPLLAHAGADEQAVEMMRYVIPKAVSALSWLRADVVLREFNCREDVRALLERAGMRAVKNQEPCGP